MSISRKYRSFLLSAMNILPLSFSLTWKSLQFPLFSDVFKMLRHAQNNAPARLEFYLSAVLEAPVS